MPQQAIPQPYSLVNGPLMVEPNNSLWRYVSIPVLFLYLQGRIRLSSIRELRRLDPNEGVRQWDCVTQTDAFIGIEHTQLFEYIKSTMSQTDLKALEANTGPGSTWPQEAVFNRWHNILIATRYALCYFESTHESIAMWNG
jgi:hypothetical protein